MQLASFCYVADRIEICPSLGSKEMLAKLYRTFNRLHFFKVEDLMM